MVNLELLQDVIDRSGVKKAAIAERMGISRQALRNILAGRTEIRESHIHAFCTVLNLSPEQRVAIFLDLKDA